MVTIGIDFGTTNCSAAIQRDGRVELIPLEGDDFILPSTICITQEQEISFGREAIQRYLQLTRETPIRYKFTDLRALTSVFQHELEDPIVSSDHDLVLVSSAGEDEDLDTPARLFQSLKSGLRDPTFQGSTVYGRYYTMEELIGLVLGRIRERAEAHLGQPVRGAVIGRPITYAPPDRAPSLSAEEIDHTAYERMLAAAHIAGFTHVTLEFEPVGAARHLRSRLRADGRALVFDFGGGTLDLAIARVMPDSALEILATHGTHVGGDDFDSAIARHTLLKHFGEGTTLTHKQLPFPPNLLEPLLHWQTIPLLATPASAARIAAIKRQSNAPETIENLQTLVRQGLGFQLFQAIEAAKIQLSSQREAEVALHERGLHIQERVTRAAFVAAITGHLTQIERALHRVLEEARFAPADLDAVLMTGGSSLVPVVQGLVRRIFGADKAQIADPFVSIASGLGSVAAEGDYLQPVAGVVPQATAARIKAEAVTIGETVAFRRGHQTVEGVVVRRAGGRLHDATLVIEFWDDEIEQFVSTMRHETKVTRVKIPR